MITIITPCSRGQNLLHVFNSLNFDFIFEWIIVYDTNHVDIKSPLFIRPLFNTNKISEYFYSTPNTKWGTAQRNYGLAMIKNKNSYIYFLDDDNKIHPNFYKFLETISLENEKIYTFNQDNHGILSAGNSLYIGGLDTALYLIHYKFCEGKKWKNDVAHDALFFLDCFENNEDKHVYINETLCYFNALRK